MELAELKERIKLTRKEGGDLIAYLETLSDEQWNAPSACKGWSVADVVGHMVFAFRDICYNGVSRGLQGDASIPEGFPDPENLPNEVRAKFIFDMALKNARELGPELLPTFKSYVEKVCDLWETLTPDNWDAPCYRPPGIRPAHTFVSTPIIETAMHHWDIRSKLDEAEAYLSQESMAYIIQQIISRPPVTMGEKLPTPVRYRFDSTSAEYSPFDIVTTGDTASTEPIGTVAADATFICDAETLVLLMYGRQKPHESVEKAKLILEGEDEHLNHFANWFRGV